MCNTKPKIAMAMRKARACNIWRIIRARMLRRREIIRFYAAQKRALIADERGAVTVEYAVLISVGVVAAGVLVAILRSPEVRQALTDMVQNALTVFTP